MQLRRQIFLSSGGPDSHLRMVIFAAFFKAMAPGQLPNKHAFDTLCRLLVSVNGFSNCSEVDYSEELSNQLNVLLQSHYN